MALTLCFLVIAIISLIKSKQENLMDSIMYVICLVLNLVFLGLETFNTFHSFKTGSNFVKNLSYNEDNSLNTKLLVTFGFVDILGVFAFIYLSIIYKGEYDLPLSQLAPLAKSISITFTATIFVNITFTLLFPILGKEDQSLQLNNKKTSDE